MTGFVSGYFVLLLLFVFFFGLSLFFGVREWWRPRDNVPLPVDVEYVRVENYFGISFRSKMQEWLKTARPVEADHPWTPPIRSVLQKSNGERIVVLTGGTFGGPGQQQELVYCEGNLFVAASSIFNKEIYAVGNMETAPGVQLQAAAADGELVLGSNSEVSRWLDAHKKVLLRQGSVVHSRVSSSEAIELEPQISVQSLYAPSIRTTGYQARCSAPAEQNTKGARDRRSSAADESADPLDGMKVTHLSPDTTMVPADLELKAGSRVAVNVVVRGTLRTAGHCRFEGSVHARTIELGPDNYVAGNLISGGSLQVGEYTQVRKNVVAETDVILKPGVTIGEAAQPVVISAGGEIRMERNVAIHGKAAAGRAVVTT